jgi:hypothetical protein
MDRRAFINTVAFGLAIARSAAEAQQAAKAARIGYLANVPAANPHLHEAFRQGLRNLGYVEGRNVAIEVRSAEGKSNHRSGLLTKPGEVQLRTKTTRGQKRSQRQDPASGRSTELHTRTRGRIAINSGNVSRRPHLSDKSPWSCVAPFAHRLRWRFLRSLRLRARGA